MTAGTQLSSLVQHATARTPPYATYLAQALLYVTVGPIEDRQSFVIIRYLSEEPASMFSTSERNEATTLAEDTNEIPARLFKFSAAPTLRGYHVEAVRLSSIQGRACVIRKNKARMQPTSGDEAAQEVNREGRDGREWVLWAALPATLSNAYFHWMW